MHFKNIEEATISKDRAKYKSIEIKQAKNKHREDRLMMQNSKKYKEIILKN